jgi:1-acyl-sn-glycerol-3-phosphate acyltransferase
MPPRQSTKRQTRPRQRAPRLVRPLLAAVERSITEATAKEAFQRDPRFVRLALRAMKLVNTYFGCELRGWKNLPRRHPVLIVGNHSGGAMSVDIVPLLVRWVEERGPKAPLYFLGYDLVFASPVFGTWLRKMGGIPASHQNAERALKSGASVIVLPGGDHEVFRPWSRRNVIDFGGRTGFITLALHTGVPVVPMTIHGAHESTFVLTRGRRIARWLGSDQLKIEVFPFIWNIPFGVTPAFIPSLALPSKVTVELGRPLDWLRYGRAKSNDPRVVKRCYNEIVGVMQATLDRLAAEHPFPILTRLNELRPRFWGKSA